MAGCGKLPFEIPDYLDVLDKTLDVVTATQVTARDVPTYAVQVRNPSGNGITAYWGTRDNISAGYKSSALAPGEDSGILPCSNLNRL